MSSNVQFRIFPALLLGCALCAGQVRAAVIVASEFGGSLQDAVWAAGDQGHLIVDGSYELEAPLVLPQRFRLSGISHQGAGVLIYNPEEGAAITIDAGVGWVTIEDLDIEGHWSPGGAFDTHAFGIDLTNASGIFLRNLTIRGFHVGVYGENSFYVHAQECNVSLNQRYNYALLDNSNSWRIQGGLSSQSGAAAIWIENSNNAVIDAVSMESNQVGIHTNTESTHILNNRFECSPAVPLFCSGTPVGVQIGPSATRTSLVANYYSGVDPVVDDSAPGQTHRLDSGHTSTLNSVEVHGDLRLGGNLVTEGEICIGSGC